MTRLVYIAELILVLAAVFAIAKCSKGPKPGDPMFGVPPGPTWSEEGYQLILNHEVGGGKKFYNRWLSHPTWPGYASGVTIGVGYDLGYNSKKVIQHDWWQLHSDKRARLSDTSGVTGSAAKLLLRKVRDIEVPWNIAEDVFNRVTIGRFWQLTQRAFPGVEALCPRAQWACMSIVFNRGNSMTGNRRREMREIREAVDRQDYEAIAKANRASVRIWSGSSIERGMQRRRFAESALVERCL